MPSLLAWAGTDLSFISKDEASRAASEMPVTTDKVCESINWCLRESGAE